MPARRPLPDDTTERLKAAMKKAKTKDEYRGALCLWLRHRLGLSATEVASVVLWSADYVRKLQSRYFRKGEAAFDLPGRGGRRRCLLSLRAEKDLLRRLREEAWPSNTMDFGTVYRAMERAVGRPVDPAAVHRMLTRHGRGRSAIVAARQIYPAHMPTGEEELPG